MQVLLISVLKVLIKPVNHAFFVNHLCSGPPIENVHIGVQNLPVGELLKDFWQILVSSGVSPRIVSILRKSDNLPFKVKPPLIRNPIVKSGYANICGNSYLLEALHFL